MRKPEFIARQSRRPTGLLGAIVARVMARETRPENERALHLLDLADGDSFIDRMGRIGPPEASAEKRAGWLDLS